MSASSRKKLTAQVKTQAMRHRNGAALPGGKNMKHMLIDGPKFARWVLIAAFLFIGLACSCD